MVCFPYSPRRDGCELTIRIGLSARSPANSTKPERGRPLDRATLHRPERLADLADTAVEVSTDGRGAGGEVRESPVEAVPIRVEKLRGGLV